MNSKKGMRLSSKFIINIFQNIDNLINGNKNIAEYFSFVIVAFSLKILNENIILWNQKYGDNTTFFTQEIE